MPAEVPALTDAECDAVAPILFRGFTYRVSHGQTWEQAARVEHHKAVRKAWAILFAAAHGRTTEEEGHR